MLRYISILFVFLFLIFPSVASSAEIDLMYASRTAPSIGNYHVQYIKTSINKDPIITKAYNLLTDLEFDEAAKVLSSYIEKRNPFDKNGNISKSLTQSDKEILSEAYMFLGYCYLNVRDRGESISALNNSIKLNPKNDCAYFYLGNHYLHIGDTNKMKDYLKKALEINPRFNSALRLLAETYKDEGSMKESIGYYKKIVDMVPESAYYRFQYYRILVGAGDYEEAELQIKKLMEMEPNFKLNYLRLADIYKRETKFQKALNEYEKLLTDDRFKQLALVGISSVYVETGDIKSAKKYLLMADALGGKRSAEANEVSYNLSKRELAARKDAIKYAGLIGVIIVLVIAISIFLKANRRRKYIQSVVSYFNECLERIYDVKELSVFLPEFFSQRLDMKNAIMLLYNRQNNSLSQIDSRMDSKDDLKIKVVTGNEVTNWLFNESKPILSLKDVEKSKVFEEAFPSLAKRLGKLGMTHLITLKEKNTCVGFLALGGGVNGKNNNLKQKDLLEPLITIASQSLQTLYLFETSIVDELTGLYNKRYFFQTLTAELKRSDRYKQPCSLCTLDIDDFKKLNDTYGHVQGDQVLKELGTIIRDSIREGIDTGIRAGGEEFIIILPATTTELALTVADRIRKTIKEHQFQGFEPGKQITVSVGISTYPDYARSDSELIKSSDKSLYLAKRTGKDKVCQASELYTSKARKSFKSEIMLENRFDHLNIKDEATGLFNFSYFSMRIKEELKRADRYNLACAVTLFTPVPDIDESNRDEIMPILAQVLKTQHREGIDTPTKFSDTTVLMITPETTVAEAGKMAARIKKSFDSKEITYGDKTFRLSVGISSYPECSADADELLASANSALTRAKMLSSRIAVAPIMDMSKETET